MCRNVRCQLFWNITVSPTCRVFLAEQRPKTKTEMSSYCRKQRSLWQVIVYLMILNSEISKGDVSYGLANKYSSNQTLIKLK